MRSTQTHGDTFAQALARTLFVLEGRSALASIANRHSAWDSDETCLSRQRVQGWPTGIEAGTTVAEIDRRSRAGQDFIEMIGPRPAMCSMMQAVCAALVFCAMSGCRVGDPHTVFVDNGRLTATVVLSTYAERPCINGVHTEIVAAATDRISNDFFPSGPFRQMVDNSRRTNSDFPGHFGQIFSFPALPGDYFMIPYKEGELDVPALTRRKFRFTAVAGATVYIGEFHLSSASECGPGFAMEVRDESDRDLAAIGRLKPGTTIGRTIKNIAVAQ